MGVPLVKAMRRLWPILLLLLSCGASDGGALEDPDHDGLTTAWEQKWGLDPTSADTDSDGIPDGDEVGDLDNPTDSDGDGIIDAIESAILDSDHDCLPDEQDPHNTVPDERPDLIAKVACTRTGVCNSDAVKAWCENGTPHCDFSAVPFYESEEASCDGLDNDCDGRTDEGFTLRGIPIGFDCDAQGICGRGVVECAKDGKGAVCSTGPGGSEDRSRPEACNGLDDDCDGETDEGLTYKGAPVGAPCTGEGECGPGVVECDVLGQATCSSNPGQSQDASTEEICDGLDNDCDGETDEDAVIPGSPVEYCKPAGVCALASGEAVLICLDGAPACEWHGVEGYSGPVEAKCDGLDDDCDGPTDEDFVLDDPLFGPSHVGEPCGTGACAGGTVTCKNGGVACSTMEKATNETCNQQDDDCDGVVDNGLYKEYSNIVFEAMTGGPRPRASVAVAACPQENVLYIYGGAARTGPDGTPLEALSDLWRYDLLSRKFTRVSIGDGPGPRAGAQLLPDPKCKRLFLLGGVLSPSAPDGPLWVFDLEGGKWSPLKVVVPQVGSIGAALENETLTVVRTDLPEAARVITCDLASEKVEETEVSIPYARLPGFGAMPDGSIVVSGGYTTTGVPQQGLYIISKGGKVMASFGKEASLPRRAEHGVVASEDGLIWLIGGVSDAKGTVAQEMVTLDPSSKKVQVSGPSPMVRMPGCAWASKAAYVVFGIATDGKAAPLVLRLDPAAMLWKNDPLDIFMPARSDGKLLLIPSKRAALVLGGVSDDLKGPEPLTDVWTISLTSGVVTRLGPPGTTPVFVQGAAAVDEETGAVYGHGGLDGPPGVGEPVSTFWRLGAAEPLPDMAGPRSGHVMVAMGQGHFLLHGGERSGPILGDAWKVLVEKDTAIWEKVPAKSHPLAGHAAVWDAKRHRMLVFGGTPSGGVSALDPDLGVWSTLASHPWLECTFGQAILDPVSDHVLFVCAKGALFATLRPDGGVDLKELPLPPALPGVQAGFDPFGRQALFFGGVMPSGWPSGQLFVVPEVCPK